jgi:hypothetical protein
LLFQKKVLNILQYKPPTFFHFETYKKKEDFYTMKKIIFTLTLFSLFACKKVKTDPVSSDCFETTIEKFKKQADAVQLVSAVIKGDTVYLLDRGARHYDSVDYIINNKCDTVGLLCGECSNPDKLGFELTTTKQTILWKK